VSKKGGGEVDIVGSVDVVDSVDRRGRLPHGHVHGVPAGPRAFRPRPQPNQTIRNAGRQERKQRMRGIWVPAQEGSLAFGLLLPVRVFCGRAVLLPSWLPYSPLFSAASVERAGNVVMTTTFSRVVARRRWASKEGRKGGKGGGGRGCSELGVRCSGTEGGAACRCARTTRLESRHVKASPMPRRTHTRRRARGWGGRPRGGPRCGTGWPCASRTRRLPRSGPWRPQPVVAAGEVPREKASDSQILDESEPECGESAIRGSGTREHWTTLGRKGENRQSGAPGGENPLRLWGGRPRTAKRGVGAVRLAGGGQEGGAADAANMAGSERRVGRGRWAVSRWHGKTLVCGPGRGLG